MSLINTQINNLYNLGFTNDFIEKTTGWNRQIALKHQDGDCAYRNDDDNDRSSFDLQTTNSAFVRVIRKDPFRKVYSENDIEKIGLDALQSDKVISKEMEDLYYDCNHNTLYYDQEHTKANIDTNFFESSSRKSSIADDNNKTSSSLPFPRSSSLSKTTKNNEFMSFQRLDNSKKVLPNPLEFPAQQIQKLEKLTQKINEDVLDSNKIIKAYRSKHKDRNWKQYLQNSKITEIKNKFKFYHKCNFPGCTRTFSSSGWLKTHLDEHMLQIKNDEFNSDFNICLEKLKYIM